MSIPLQAMGALAATPYDFPRILLRVFSVEELCYLFKTNPFILDATILDRSLIAWLAESCELPELARELAMIQRRNPSGVSEFVGAILHYTCYLTAEENEQIKKILDGNINVSAYEKEINRADFLLEKGKYQYARQTYESILNIIPEGERLLSARIYHNRSVALARMFMFEQAAAGFLTAYEMNGRPESGRSYLASIRLSLSEAEYLRFIGERPAFHDFSLEIEHIYIQALKGYNETDKQEKQQDDSLEKTIGAIKHEYRSFLET
jgi:tetratricopeptide (TPR) repeat protein